MPLKILLADDSMTAQKMGEKILEEAGYEVVAVSNGAAATKKIASEKPDLIILDIYMPGYTGLEICQRVKADPATAKVPVVLTVGQVEPYNPEDAEKVKADGVIVKPFVPSDLVAAIKKIEERLSAPAAPPPPPPVDTVEITAPAIAEFPDASYQEWKESAEAVEEHPIEEAPRRAEVSVPDEMAAAPAFGLDMLGEEPAPPPPVVQPPKSVASHATDSLVEFTSAPQAGDVVAHGKDPALVTDASEMATAFPTRFGVEGAEVMPGGFTPEMMAGAAPAAEEPAAAEPTAEAAPAAEPEPVPVAVVAPPSEEERLQLAREMQAAVADMPVEPVPVEEAAPAPVPEPEPAPIAFASPPPAAEPHSDLELAAAMAVAVGATAEPVVAAPAAATTSLDANAIAMIVHKVTERMKPQLIEEIARELAAEAERMRR
ncbi:MAG TPA: response regulator [Terriglobales bacterium]|nr:response regulator [Terriglobales bacterium]